MTGQPTASTTPQSSRRWILKLRVTLLASLLTILAVASYRIGVNQGTNLSNAAAVAPPTRNAYEVRVYYVGDLLSGRAEQPEKPEERFWYWPYENLMQRISETVAKGTWDDWWGEWLNPHGEGELQPFTELESLVVRQTPANHAKLSDFLRSLRDRPRQSTEPPPKESASSDPEGDQ